MGKLIRRSLGVLSVMALAMTFFAVSQPAEAAGPRYCSGYANSAVHQQTRNLRRGCGFFGPRWHRAWRLHYSWCRGVPRWRARDERRHRRVLLRRCRW